MVQSLNETPSGHCTGFDQGLLVTWKWQEAEHVVSTASRAEFAETAVQEMR